MWNEDGSVEEWLNETPLAQIASSRGLFCLWHDM
jgi:hypothetical protein